MTVLTFATEDFTLSPHATSAASLDEASLQLPSGAYVTFRTFGGSNALHLNWHLDRLLESAALEGVPVTLDRRKVRQLIADALDAAGFPESRVRLTLAYSPPGTVFITVEELRKTPAEAYDQGVACALAARSLRRSLPRAKSTRFIAAGAAARAAQVGSNEVLLVDDDGFILEGSSSNFFAVLGGRLHTAEEGILLGTTRRMVLELAATELEVRLQPIRVTDLTQISEAFISSVSRAVLPVATIEGRSIGTGLPGPVTRTLMRLYEDRVQREIEPIRE